jgi:hypothetical protein
MMRCLSRNKTPFYFAPLEGQSEIIDEYGNATGQYEVSYLPPSKTYGNISAARGEMQSRQFGESETYDKVIVLDNPQVAIDEYTILWVDTLPKLMRDGSLVRDDNGEVVTPHDYIVKKVARSLNNVSIAISKVVVR